MSSVTKISIETRERFNSDADYSKFKGITDKLAIKDLNSNGIYQTPLSASNTINNNLKIQDDDMGSGTSSNLQEKVNIKKFNAN